MKFTGRSPRFGQVRAKAARAAVCTLAFAALAAEARAQNVSATWGANSNSAWYTATNWSGSKYAGVQGAAAANTNVATFTSAFTGTTVGINMGTASLNLGAISLDSTRTTATNIGNSSGTAGVLRLYGSTVNSVANVIVRNAGSGLLTLQAAQSGTMGVVLGSTDSLINVDGSGGVSISSVISGANSNLTFNATGTGTLTLSGANTFSGSFTAGSGTTFLTANGALGGATTVNVASGAIISTAIGTTNTINDAAAVTVNGNLDTSGAMETIGSVAGTNTGAFLTIGKSSNSSGSLTVGDSTSTTFAGVIRDGAAGTGTGAFTKQGAGRLTLTGTNTFTGTVNVTAGTLAASNTGGAALGTVTAVNVGAGGTLLFGAANQINASAPIALGTTGGSSAAVLNAANNSQGTTTTAGLGALTLLSTANIDFGTLSSTTGNSVVLHFGDSSASTWASGVKLSILDYAGIVTNQTGVPIAGTSNSDDLQFGSTATALTTTQVGQIQFVNPIGADGTQYTGVYGATIGATGQVFAVVPEPATVLGGLLLVGALGWNQRRRLGGRVGTRRLACAA